MPTFDFTSPEGKTYSVTGPEGATKEQAFQILQSQLSQGIDPNIPTVEVRAKRGGDQEGGGVASDIARQLGLTARYGIEGASAGAGMLTDPFINAIGGAVRAVTGNDYAPETLASIGQHVANALGLPQPENSAERLVGAASRGLAGGVTGAGTASSLAGFVPNGMAGSVLNNLATAPAMQAGAGAAAGAAGQGVSESGGSPAAQLAASLAAGIAAPVAGVGVARAVRAARTPPAAPVAAPAVEPVDAAGLTALAKQATESVTGKKAATLDLAEQTMPDAKTIAAAKRLGIEEHLQPDHVTTSQAYRELAQAVKSIPGSQGRAAEMEGLEAVGKRASSLVDEYGGTHDLSAVDSGLKGRMQQTVDELSTKADKAYADLRAAIPARDEVDTPSILGFIKNRAEDLGGVKNLSPTEKMILGKLSPKTTTSIEEVPGNSLMPGAQSATKKTVQTTTKPTYALLDDVRRDLTAARVQRAGPFKDADTGLIKVLEANLKNDQRAAVEPYGQLAQFDAARSLVAVRKGIERDMASLFGKQLTDSMVPKLKAGVAALPKGDTSKFVRFIQAVPESMRQEVVASGLSSAFNVSAKNQNPSFTNFVHFYEGLMRNKQAAAAVFSNLPPEARKQLSDLYRVSKGISNATRERITTGRINAIRDDFKPADNLGARIYDAAKHQVVAVGAGAVAGGATSAVLGPAAGSAVGAAVASALSKGAKPKAIEAADRLLMSPEFQAAVKQAQAGRPRQASKQFVGTKAFKAFAAAIKNPRIAGNPEAFVFDALTAHDANQEAENPRNKGK